MSFDLAVWEGTRPDSDAAAASIYAQLMGRLESEEEAPPPSPAIRTFVDTLLARWRDITDDDGDDSPWADGPLIGNASGDAIYFSMVWSRADEAAAYVAQVAAEQGLVCFGPQSERFLLPVEERSWKRRWFRREWAPVRVMPARVKHSAAAPGIAGILEAGDFGRSGDGCTKREFQLAPI